MARSLLLLLCAALAGCATSQIAVGGPGVTRIDGAQLPLPEGSDLASPVRPYRIGPLDELVIDVFGIEDLSKKEVQVDGSGRLSCPRAGTLEVSGKTPGEAAGMIEAALRGKYIRNPQVTVNLTKTVSQVVTVEGEVEKPGLYPVLGRMSLLRAIATAEGTTEFSSLQDVVVLRTVSGQTYVALYNLRAIRRGAYPDPEIFANDTVVVGDSRWRRLFKDFLQVAPLLSTPIILALQN